MRSTLLTSLALLVMILAAPATAAPTEPPPWSVELLRPSEEALVDGWTLAEGEPEKLVERIEELAEASGYDTFSLTAEAFRIEKEKRGVLDAVFIDFDEDPAELRAVLDKAASKDGWEIRDLGSKYRLLIVAGGKGTKKKRVQIRREGTQAVLVNAARLLGARAADVAVNATASSTAAERRVDTIRAMCLAAKAMGGDTGVADAATYLESTIARDKIQQALSENRDYLKAYWEDDEKRIPLLAKRKKLLAARD